VHQAPEAAAASTEQCTWPSALNLTSLKLEIGQGAEMTQALYAHMNNKRKKNK
jgi:hypothetical protein